MSDAPQPNRDESTGSQAAVAATLDRAESDSALQTSENTQASTTSADPESAAPVAVAEIPAMQDGPREPEAVPAEKLVEAATESQTISPSADAADASVTPEMTDTASNAAAVVEETTVAADPVPTAPVAGVPTSPPQRELPLDTLDQEIAKLTQDLLSKEPAVGVDAMADQPVASAPPATAPATAEASSTSTPNPLPTPVPLPVAQAAPAAPQPEPKISVVMKVAGKAGEVATAKMLPAIALASKPLEGKPAATRHSVGVVGVFTSAMAAVLWGYLVFFRQPPQAQAGSYDFAADVLPEAHDEAHGATKAGDASGGGHGAPDSHGGSAKKEPAKKDAHGSSGKKEPAKKEPAKKESAKKEPAKKESTKKAAKGQAQGGH